MKLYDHPADVIRKAIQGHGLSPAEVADRIGVEAKKIMSLIGGNFDETLARALAPVLGLDAEALCGLGIYDPGSTLPTGITQHAVPFEDEEVNIWLIKTGDTTVAIDAGSRKSDLAEIVAREDPRSVDLLVTHAHRDHVAGITSAADWLREIRGPAGVPGSREVQPGDSFRIGSLEIEVIDLAGHHPRAVGYRIQADSFRAIAVGDAVFAGSMGGCPDADAFRDARRTIEAALKGQDDDLLILTGHGSPTTLGAEKTGSPFLAGWNL